jgi:hypothetical protein
MRLIRRKSSHYNNDEGDDNNPDTPVKKPTDGAHNIGPI